MEGVRCVDGGLVLTSAGVSVNIDLVLHLVERHESAGRAAEVARIMEYESYGTATSAAAGPR